MGYGKEVYIRAEEIMEKRRQFAEQEQEKRRAAFYRECPRAQEIEYELAGISVAAAKSVIGGANLKNQIEELMKKSLLLQNELNALLELKGYPKNYLEPWYECEKCKDIGNIDGRICGCMKALVKKIAYEQLNSISPLSLCTFESFALRYYPEIKIEHSEKTQHGHMQSVLNFCMKYAEGFSDQSHSLLLQGGPGLGKTHLSLAIAQKVIDRGFGVIYVSVPDIVMQLEKEHFGGRFDEKGESETLLTECDLLILDDLGTEFQTKYTVATIYNIINKRMLTSHPTIISTNLTLTEMQQLYGNRMISRIIGMLDRLEFVGSDIRQMKRRERKKSNKNTED